MTPESPSDRERRGAAGLLLTHAAMLVLFDGLIAFADLRTSAVALSLVKDNPTTGGLAASSALVMFQVLSAGGVLGCAGLEGMAAWRTLQGQAVPLRGAGIASVLGSLLLVPTVFVGCSLCGAALWPLPLGFSLATLAMAVRAPDPRQETP